MFRHEFDPSEVHHGEFEGIYWDHKNDRNEEAKIIWQNERKQDPEYMQKAKGIVVHVGLEAQKNSR